MCSAGNVGGMSIYIAIKINSDFSGRFAVNNVCRCPCTSICSLEHCAVLMF